jgi:RNA polymerase sigma factor (sigma-70 family)
MSDWTPDIERLQAYNDEEWMQVERAYCGRLMAYVARRIDDAQAREDVVQEVFLGAVRGIPSFDAIYTFEQYLFGICRNRTIDHLRRRSTRGVGASQDSSDSLPGLDDLVTEAETPSGVVSERDLASHGQQLLVEVLREWVQETWQLGEFTRLMVIEALFHGGWRNRDTWKRFGLRDETAVAGIKFRALKRLRLLATRRDPTGTLLPRLAEAAGEGTSHLELGVMQAWKGGRVSCPARYWVARLIAGNLPEEPAVFVRFHLDEMGCDFCQANHDDLARMEATGEDPFLERIQASTGEFLRSQIISAESEPRE